MAPYLKRIALSIGALFCLFLGSTAHPVDSEAAQAIAAQFMRTHDLRLAGTYYTNQNNAALYVFNTESGFVIVAADDRVAPIVGYSHEGRFDPDNVPIPLEGYLRDYAEMIQYSIDNQIITNNTSERTRTTGAIEPLLTEHWHQGCLYNSLCPALASAPCGHAEVGCVAVAMGQVMHYWRYPTTGWGSHSYNNSGFALSADFGGTTYDWDHIHDQLDEASSDIEVEALATLLLHCGIAVDMRYTSTGSLANPSGIPDAMIRYFDYSRHLRMEKRADYNDEEWAAMLKECLDKRQPIIYSGYGSAGHTFVCDGYDSNDLFHFNWGWGGNADGYFSLGNINPSGHVFNNNNYAILDIVPQFEPCLVTASVSPLDGGIVEGTGSFHYGVQCTIKAIPSEGFDFYCWTRAGQVFSKAPTIILDVMDDITDLEAHFTYFLINEVTASYAPEENDPSSPQVQLSWNYDDHAWVLLKQFGIHGVTSGIISDDESIYIAYDPLYDPPVNLEKYTMDGVLVEAFNLDNLQNVFSLSYDGSQFYCNGLYDGHLTVLYHIDLDNKTVLESVEMGTYFSSATYDPDYDGFWLAHDYNLLLYDRQGNWIISSPMLPEYILGSCHIKDKDGNPHLLVLLDTRILDYDITSNVFQDRPLLEFDTHYEHGYGACRLTYDGKEAMAFAMGDTISIYEIRSTFEQIPQIMHYRIYRSYDEGQPVLVADDVTGYSYLDPTWDMLINGIYRYGISAVYADGSASEVVWSNPIAKTNYGIDELIEPQGVTVQKILEDGHLYILVNGKKYNITGQEIK